MRIHNLFSNKARKKQNVQKEILNSNVKGLKNVKTFVCSKCKKELEIKYLYRDGMCADCAPGRTVEKLCSKGIRYSEKKDAKPAETKSMVHEDESLGSMTNNHNKNMFHINNTDNLPQFGMNRIDLIENSHVIVENSQANRQIYELFRVSPPVDWEISIVGLDVRTGKAWREDVRQCSYGAFLGGESQWTELSYEDVDWISKQLRVSGDEREYGGLNESTWKNYIPQEIIEEVTPKLPELKQKPRNEFAIHANINIDAIFVHTVRRFGEDYQFLRKCNRGYRALHIVTAKAGATMCKLPDLPDEQYILDLLEKRTKLGCVHIYDRLLTEDDLRYIIQQIKSTKLYNSVPVENARVNISIYGGETVAAAYWKGGRRIPCAGRAAHDVGSAIGTCAQYGVLPS